jgi:hypothetical protein
MEEVFHPNSRKARQELKKKYKMKKKKDRHFAKTKDQQVISS